MKAMPQSVKGRIANARHYLEAARRSSGTAHVASRISSLLTALENVRIAEEEMHSWASKDPVTKGLYTSHEVKFSKVHHGIAQVVFDPQTGKADTVWYKTGSELKELHQTTRYGPDKNSPDVTKHFERGWHTEEFENEITLDIEWEEMMVTVYESLPDYGK